MQTCWWLYLSVFLVLAGSFQEGGAQQEKYRLCMVKVSNRTRSITKYCPLLNENGSRAECVVGNSRLDCLRLIIKNKADFAKFEAEDLIVAANEKSDELSVTNEVRLFEKYLFEYEVVAVVRKSSAVSSLTDLKEKKLCHPGYGFETDWSDVMAKFFEARVVPQQCDTSLTLEENAIKSSSQFFKEACKAGAWVPDAKLDHQLKKKYPNLCQLCDIPSQCSVEDKYWGRTGPLFCLTDGLGEVAWARLDDVKAHFGFVHGVPPAASPTEYSLLCDNGAVTPLDKLEEPCSWLARPWPAIIARRPAAEGVKKLISSLKGGQSGINWQWALQQLLNSLQTYVLPLDNNLVPEDYLARAQGFLSANTMAHCDSQRVLRICTRSNVETSKCNWLKEAALAYGVEPKVMCMRFKSTEECMKAVQDGVADVVNVGTDADGTARKYKKYGLKPLVFEFTTKVPNLFNVAAVVKNSSLITSLEDLKGKKACFPVYDGVGWNTLIATLKSKSLLSSDCPYTKAIGEYFSEACVPGLNNSLVSQPNLQKLCNGEKEREFSGEAGAFKCLASGKGDVAFIEESTISKNTDGVNTETWAANLKAEDFRILCVESDIKNCYLSWATLGQMLVKADVSPMRSTELSLAFKQISTLFGKHYRTRLPTFLLFGEHDGQSNILFQDVSERLEDYESLPRVGKRPRNYEHMMANLSDCSTGGAATKVATILSFVMVIWSFILV